MARGVYVNIFMRVRMYVSLWENLLLEVSPIEFYLSIQQKLHRIQTFCPFYRQGTKSTEVK
jgi:hypothetical protein